MPNYQYPLVEHIWQRYSDALEAGFLSGRRIWDPEQPLALLQSSVVPHATRATLSDEEVFGFWCSAAYHRSVKSRTDATLGINRCRNAASVATS
jgi:hypothetical protein